MRQINLGAAASYGIYGASSVTNTGSTIIDGDLGTGGTSVTGFGPGIINGNLVTGGATSAVLTDASAAFTNITNSIPDEDLTGENLGNRILPPGTYSFDDAAQLTGTLILEGTRSPDDLWFFQIGEALTTATASAVIFSNGGLACQVYWAVGSSVTLGTGTSFAGTILAGSSVTFSTGASLSGRAFGLSATVTLDTNAVSVPDCPVASSSTSISQQSSISSLSSLLSSGLFLTSTSSISLGTSSTPLSEIPSSTAPFTESRTSFSMTATPSVTVQPSLSTPSITSTITLASASTGSLLLSSSTLLPSSASQLDSVSSSSLSTDLFSQSSTLSTSSLPSLSLTSILSSTSMPESSSVLSSASIMSPYSLLSSTAELSSTSMLPTSPIPSTSSLLSSTLLSSTSSLTSFSNSLASSISFQDSSTTFSSTFLFSSTITTSTVIVSSSTTSRQADIYNCASTIIMTTKTTTHLFHSTQTQTAMVHVTVKDTTTISIIKLSGNTATTKVTNTLNVTKTTISTICLSSLFLARSDTDLYPLESETEGLLADSFPTSQPCENEYPVTTNVPLATISTLTSCPHKASCTGQTSTWTGRNGPLPCSAQSTCSCVLPGGTQPIPIFTTSVDYTGQAIEWNTNSESSACVEGVICGLVLPEATRSLLAETTESLLVACHVVTGVALETTKIPEPASEQVDHTATSMPFDGVVSPLPVATSTPAPVNSGCGFLRRVDTVGIIAIAMILLWYI
ncbi:hypothetical protein ONS95_006272 [Cadophora gregata]|uniref:uncharacterized protein n=1 Tax=Cadophora gregata TaxID=51156 RepID=UPI0026DCA4A8|nr:uncharacterized protein ONS95_006272 [Cadophora gregata]KAK0102670.1 hypothetical protein ONS95_006272 [Cadophora gregata]KAK0104326.1 hypothetical protein ONS96_005411 [Cadophora gregata f. sp. sojae]